MDDVAGLAATARAESFLFVVDSSQRDAAAYPTPSTYEIAFSAPFRNVVGVDLVDASVPRTEYTVEAGRNELVYALGQPASSAGVADLYAAARRRAVVPPGDYNLPQLIERLNAALAAPDMPLRETDWTPVTDAAEARLSVAAATVPSEVSNRVRLAAAESFTVFAARSSIRPVLGLANPVTTADTALAASEAVASGLAMVDPATREERFGVAPGWTGATHADVFLSLPRVSDTDVADVLVGPLPVMDALAVTGVQSARQYFVAAATGPPRAVSAYCTGGGSLTARLYAAPGGVPTGAAIDSTTLTGGGAETPVPRTPATGRMTTATYLVAGETYCLDLSAAAGAAAVFHAASNLGDAGRVTFADGATETTVLAGEDLCAGLAVAVADHGLTPPGLVNLSGERYVTIRSPEIDAHMYRDRASERFHAGLGMVKMPGYGYRDQRYDFVSFPHRTFHPIGRLSRFTVRLEKGDGTLYDAHGLDHTLTLVVRYLTAPAGADQRQHDTRLNPAYDRDMTRYRLAHGLF